MRETAAPSTRIPCMPGCGPISGAARPVMRGLMAALFAAAGVAHLRAPETFLMFSPGFVPFAREVIFPTGLFEITAAAALVTRPLRRSAGIALALYSLAVWPANIKHALEGIDVPPIP